MVLYSRFLRLVGGTVAVFALLGFGSSARALLNFDGTRNQLFVFGGVSFGYTDNLFAEADGRGDYNVSARVGAELKRRAGLIAVDAVGKVDFVKYNKFSDEDTVNPNFSVTLTKTDGRATGTLTVKAYRESRSDAAVNLRTSSWNFPVNLEIKYPINEKFYVTSGTGYVRRTYDDRQESGLVNYSDASEAVDLFYTYTSKLDLLGGYRIRVSRTSLDGRTVDHWFSVGATGAILSKLTGTVRVGYQVRDFQNSGNQYDQWNAMASLNWPFTRKLNFSVSANRDFNTIATGASVDSSSLAARANYLFSRKLDFTTGVAVGRNRFLGDTQSERHDTFFSWDVGGRYRMNEHFEFGATYTYLHNWSSFAFSDFQSNGFNIDITARY